MVPFISVCIVHIQYSGVEQSTYNPAGWNGMEWNGMERTDGFFFELFVRVGASEACIRPFL